jgi:uncharacterized protein (UPF0333 family)
MTHLLVISTKLILRRLRYSNQKGQALLEYALIFLFIVLVVIGMVTFFGEELAIYYTDIVDKVLAVL